MGHFVNMFDLWGLTVPQCGAFDGPMETQMDINYGSLGFEALVTIFEVADLLGVAPKLAAEMYLRSEARKVNKEAAA
jgi:hypothetical protein